MSHKSRTHTPWGGIHSRRVIARTVRAARTMVKDHRNSIVRAGWLL